MSSIATASGALLAISLALFFFFSKHVTDWRDKLIEKLIQGRTQLRVQIEKSAQCHPDISRHLAALYDETINYIPGQLVDMGKIDKAGAVFQDWAIEQVKKRGREIDLGNPIEYDSFELQLRDAYLCYREVKHTFRLISVVDLHIRAVTTFSPLIVVWAIIVLIALTSAIIGSMGAIPNDLNFSVLIIPFYLLLVAVFALIKDTVAIMSLTRIQEIAYDKAISSKQDLNSEVTQMPVNSQTPEDNDHFDELYNRIEKLFKSNRTQQALFSVGLAYFPVGVALLIFGTQSTYKGLVGAGIIIMFVSICLLISSLVIGMRSRKR